MIKLAELLDEESSKKEALPYAAMAIDMSALDCPDVIRVAGLLTGFATVFDREGKVAEAAALDKVLQKIANEVTHETVVEDEDGNVVQKVTEKTVEKKASPTSKDPFYLVEPKKMNRKPVPPDRESLGPLGFGLQTRYSPDLPGVHMERVEDGVYRDPVTKKTYDFRKGFVLDDGTTYSGGSVSAQTPNGTEKRQPHNEPLPVK